MDKFFKITERGSTVGTELMGGLTTFLTMAYIIAVNPAAMAVAGIPFNAALTATCFGAAAMTLLMGFAVNRPIALASGVGVSSIVAYSLCSGVTSIDWRVAMAVVFLEGCVILVLVLVGVRKAVIEAIPADLRHAIGIGIGLFIAVIGLEGGELVNADAATLITMGDVLSPACIVSIVSIFTAILLEARKVRGGLLISIIVATIVGIPLGVTPLPANWEFGLDFSAFGAPFQTVPGTDTMALLRVFLQPTLLLAVFALVMSDFFDTVGVAVAVGKQADFIDEDGSVADIKPILVVDSVAAGVGGLIGASSITSFVESASGAAAGARTGLSSIVVGLLFFAFAFCSPIIGMVTGSATCGTLLMVGYFIMRDITEIDWKHIEGALPAFVTIVGIPFCYSIVDGIGFGLVCYCFIKVCQGKARDVSVFMWVAAAAFTVMYLVT